MSKASVGPLPVAVLALPTLVDLAGYIRNVLCERDTLDPTQTPLFRTILTKAHRPCGMVFHIEGPRLLKTSAVWSADADRVLFYDSTGTRFHEVRLSESPTVPGEESEVRNAKAAT